MAIISDKLNKILSAVFGKDIRQALHDGLDAINKETENTTSRQQVLEETFDQLTINAGNSNAEIVAARVKNDGTSFDTVGKRLNYFDEQLDTNMNEINEQFNTINSIDTMPQCALTAKQGINTNSFKLFRKIDNDNYKIIQKADNGYIEYQLHKTRGDSSVSYGSNWDLLRLLSVQQVLECFLWKEPVPTSGSLTTSIVASAWNSVDSNLVYKQTSFQESNKNGLTLYDLAPNSEVTFNFTTRSNSKANILYLSNDGRSNNVEIYVNGDLVKSFNSDKGSTTGTYYTEEFDIIKKTNVSESVTVKIKNADTSKKFSFVAFNFKSLKDFKGEEIDSYKIYKMNSYFINETGASDYALRDNENNKWFGSYHGGEVANVQIASWNSTIKQGEDYFARDTNISEISSGTFSLLNNLRIIQKTRLIDRADMVSIFDFNVDGTMNMTFSLSNSDVVLKDFYTALTCTHTDFSKVVIPRYEDITLNTDNFYKIQNGYIEQQSSDGSRRMGIRFNIFNNKYNTKGYFIRNNSSYSKFYYGIVCEYSKGVIIPNLTFSKSLDFYNVLI